MKAAPIQEPKARKTKRGSMKRRVRRNGRTGVMGWMRLAKCAPIRRAEKHVDTVIMIVAGTARTEYALWRGAVVEGEKEGEGWY